MGITKQVKATETEVEQITMGKLMEDMRAVVADAEELLKATADQTGARIEVARDKAKESLKAAKALLVEQKEAVMAKYKAAAKTTNGFVSDNPWKAIGIAAAAGFVLGILAKRR